jgi:hypothetical protein
MRTLYVRNVPDQVAARLEALAASQGVSVNALVVRELTEVAGRSFNADLLAGLPGAGHRHGGGGHPVGARRPVIVIDASAVVGALAREGDARDHLVREPVAVPHLVDAEVAHALRRQVMRGALPAPEAGRRLHRWTG